MGLTLQSVRISSGGAKARCQDSHDNLQSGGRGSRLGVSCLEISNLLRVTDIHHRPYCLIVLKLFHQWEQSFKRISLLGHSPSTPLLYLFSKLLPQPQLKAKPKNKNKIQVLLIMQVVSMLHIAKYWALTLHFCRSHTLYLSTLKHCICQLCLYCYEHVIISLFICIFLFVFIRKHAFDSQETTFRNWVSTSTMQDPMRELR